MRQAIYLDFSIHRGKEYINIMDFLIFTLVCRQIHTIYFFLFSVLTFILILSAPPQSLLLLLPAAPYFLLSLRCFSPHPNASLVDLSILCLCFIFLPLSFLYLIRSPHVYSTPSWSYFILLLHLALRLLIVFLSLLVRDTAPESVMNALGSSLFHDVVSQTYKKKNDQYYADKSFGGCSKRQYF